MYYKKAEREFKDKLMREVDDLGLPKDFNDWLSKYPFKEDFYMFFRIEKHGKEKKYIGACQHCKNENISLKSAKTGKLMICPVCHKKVKLRNEKFCKTICDTKYIAVLQRLKYGHVIRHFYVSKHTDFLNFKFFLYEEERCYIDFISEDTKWFREYNCNWTFGRYKNMCFELPDIVWTYYKNLDEICFEPFEYCQLKEFAKNSEVSVLEYLKLFKRSKFIEVLAKLKMFNLISDMLGLSGASLWNNFNFESDDIKGFLGLKGEYYKYAVKRKIKFAGLKALKFLQAEHLKINKRNYDFALSYVDLYIADKFYAYVLKKIGFKKIVDYYARALRNRDKLKDYFDYLHFCDQLKYNLEDTAYLKPKDFKKAHDDAYKKVQFLQNKDVYLKAEKFFNKLQVLNYTGKEWSIVVPQHAFDLIDEGKNLCHCVGSYISRVARHESMIFFVRKNENLQKSFYTLEINPKDKTVVQCRGSHNVSASGEILKFISKWQNEKLKGLKVV